MKNSAEFYESQAMTALADDTDAGLKRAQVYATLAVAATAEPPQGEDYEEFPF